MGFLSSILRNYRNAGANVAVSLYLTQAGDQKALHEDPLIHFQCTGLELHNLAKAAKTGLLSILNESPSTYRQKIEVPRDYWRLAMRVVVNDLNKGFPSQTASLVREALCLAIESAFDSYTEGDICSVLLSRTGDVSIERQQTESPYDVFRKDFGRIDAFA